MAKRFDPLEFIATSPVGKAFGSSAVGKQIATKLGVPPSPTLVRGRVALGGPVALAVVGRVAPSLYPARRK